MSPNPILIHDIYGEEGDPQYWAKGHVDKKEFAIALEEEYELSAMDESVDTESVEHIWAVIAPSESAVESGDYFLKSSSEDDESSVPVTYWRS